MISALPDWLRNYRREQLAPDLTAGLIVTILVIPQSLGYAMLAGLPPEVGLYASVLPLIAYALFGSSMTLAVGPVAVASLMTASALQPLAAAGSPLYIMLAVQLALLTGLMLFVFGLLRLGFLAHFLSHPVIAGFIAGSAVLIVVGQLEHLVGIDIAAMDVPGAIAQLIPALPNLHVTTTVIGGATLAFLIFSHSKPVSALLAKSGIKPQIADLLTRLAPVAAVLAATFLTARLRLHETAGVAVVGTVPAGLPPLSLPLPDWKTMSALWLPAFLLALVGFVESVAVAKSLAMKRHERVVPDRELLGLGAANIGSAVSGGYPVMGGFSRSVVNFSAGAKTPLAGIVSAIAMGLLLVGLPRLFDTLPHAVLAAIIIVAVASLIDFSILREAWRYDKADAFSMLATLAGVATLGVEKGILVGVGLSLATLVWRSSRPHMAVVGRVPGTEHFRNIDRHAVETIAGLVALRVDENLFFGNAAVVEDRIAQVLSEHPRAERLLLVFSAVSRMDTTALEILTELEENLSRRGIEMCLAEVKGPVMDRLARTRLGERLKGRIFLSTHEAFVAASR